MHLNSDFVTVEQLGSYLKFPPNAADKCFLFISEQQWFQWLGPSQANLSQDSWHLGESLLFKEIRQVKRPKHLILVLLRVSIRIQHKHLLIHILKNQRALKLFCPVQCSSVARRAGVGAVKVGEANHGNTPLTISSHFSLTFVVSVSHQGKRVGPHRPCPLKEMAPESGHIQWHCILRSNLSNYI